MDRLHQKIKRLFRSSSAAKASETSAVDPGPKNELLARAQACLEGSQPVQALRFAEGAASEAKPVRGAHFFRGLCLDRIGRHEEALAAFKSELALHPDHDGARAWHDNLAKALARPVAEALPTNKRPWNTSLPQETLLRIQQSLHNYHYRGVPMLKNPFDFALYPMLIWNLKPRMIIEIGSKSGGSGLWFGDLLNNFGIDGHIYSLDVVKVDNVSHPRVTFIEGDGRQLGKTLSDEFLSALPRPWLIIEDADHVYDTSIAVLNFFDRWLQPGDYIVVEDGIISDLSNDPECNSGPHKALKEFLSTRLDRYEIDGACCDFFGYNTTWCTNGFLRRIAATEQGESAESISEAARLLDADRVSDAFATANRIKASHARIRGTDYLRARCFLAQQQPEAAMEAVKEELRYFPDHHEAAALLEKLTAELPVIATLGDREFQDLYKVVRHYTMSSEARLHSLYRLARELCEKDVPGNFVECGVAAGGSSALLAAVIARYSRRPRRLFSFDTFEGMPAPSDADTHAGQRAGATGWGGGTCAAPKDSLLEAAAKVGAAKFVEPVQGLFSDTLPANKERIGAIALLHVDGDWHASTVDVFENLFDQVTTAGRIQVDDYGYWDGCKRAVREFQEKRGLSFQINIIDETGIWIAR